MTSWYGLDDLVGVRLSSVEVLNDGELVRFHRVDGDALTYRAEGDCCSESWVEHVTVPADIDGALVTSVKSSGGVDATDEQYAQARARREYVDHLQVYHEAVVTDRGEVIVEFRNDSNGYYGGWLSRTDAGAY